MAAENRKFRHRPPVFQDSVQDSLVIFKNMEDLSWLRTEDRKFFDELADMAGPVGKHLRLPEMRFIAQKSVERVTRIGSAPSSSQNLDKLRNEHSIGTAIKKHHHPQSGYYKPSTTPKQLAVVKRPESPTKNPPSVGKTAEGRKSPIKGQFPKNLTPPAQSVPVHHYYHHQHHRRQEQQQQQQQQQSEKVSVEKPKPPLHVRRPPTKPLSPKRNYMELKQKEMAVNRYRNFPPSPVPKSTAESSRVKEAAMPKRPLSLEVREKVDPRNNISNRMGRCNLNNPYYMTSMQQPKVASPVRFARKKEEESTRKKGTTRVAQSQLKKYSPTRENQFFSCSEELTDLESFGCNDEYGGETTIADTAGRVSNGPGRGPISAGANSAGPLGVKIGTKSGDCARSSFGNGKANAATFGHGADAAPTFQV